MPYIDSFILPNLDTDFISRPPTYLRSAYPYHVLSFRGLFEVKFADVTIICGGNGTGKSTLLNVIAQKLKLKRKCPFNNSELFDQYVRLCRVKRNPMSWQMPTEISEYGRMIPSDEVFDEMIKSRIENDEIDSKRLEMFQLIDKLRDDKICEVNLEDPESIRAYARYSEAIRKSKSQFIRDNLGFNKEMKSNGENGFRYFTETIQPGGLYLLDEPENSLSAERQLDLREFIQSMARYEHCQFIISTHSPFIMSIAGAKLYNLDVYPAAVMPWTEVECVKTWRKFFLDHDKEFQ